ncbi:MAG: saccharopine dehydrogenase family protein [Nostocoides sp.]
MVEATRPYDIALFGATGFVGRLTADYLRDHAPAGAVIALAGRSRERLAQVRENLGPAAASWPVEIADAGDPEALARLAARSRVVITTVGPYAKYGMPLVGACAAAGTHYGDLTGEVLFARTVIDTCDQAAQASGAKIVLSCGFDSVPSDLAVHLLAQAAAGKGTLGETQLRVRALKGGFSGGTIDSARHQAKVTSTDPALAKIAADPYALSPDRDGEPPVRPRTGRSGGLRRLADRASAMTAMRRGADERWTAPFVMAAYNTRVVRRSNALSGYAYGRTFRYSEVTDTGSGIRGAITAAATAGTLGAVFFGLAHRPTRAVLDALLPKPGEGPSQHAQTNGYFVMDVESTTSTGAQVSARVSAQQDPGYSGTAVMLGESALSLAFDDLPPITGVLTPAIAFGDALVQRLRQQGFTLTAEVAHEAPAASAPTTPTDQVP